MAAGRALLVEAVGQPAWSQTVAICALGAPSPRMRSGCRPDRAVAICALGAEGERLEDPG